MGRVCSGGGDCGSSRLRRTTSLPTWCVLMRKSLLARSLGFGHRHQHVGCCRFCSSAWLEMLAAGSVTACLSKHSTL